MPPIYHVSFIFIIFSSLLPNLDKQGLDLETLIKKKSYDDSFEHMQIKINFINNNKENWLELEFLGDQQKRHHKNPLGLKYMSNMIIFLLQWLTTHSCIGYTHKQQQTIIFKQTIKIEKCNANLQNSL